MTEERQDRAACHIIQGSRVEHTEFTAETAKRLLANKDFFWLDLDRPGTYDFKVLQEVFGFHRLAIEASEEFGQRAKIDDYDDFVFMVVYGASPDQDRLVADHYEDQ